MKVDKSQRREHKRHKKKYGMRTRGRSIKTVILPLYGKMPGGTEETQIGHNITTMYMSPSGSSLTVGETKYTHAYERAVMQHDLIDRVISRQPNDPLAPPNSQLDIDKPIYIEDLLPPITTRFTTILPDEQDNGSAMAQDGE